MRNILSQSILEVNIECLVSFESEYKNYVPWINLICDLIDGKVD